MKSLLIKMLNIGSITICLVSLVIATALSGCSSNSKPTVYSQSPSGNPEIASFYPTSGIAGTSITITGTNLLTVSNVKFNGINALTITNITSTSFKTTVPLGAISGKITIITADGTATSMQAFTVIDMSLSTITSFTPISGKAGTVVTITGTTLSAATAIKFNGLPATTITDITATSLKATVPVNATTGQITLVAADGIATSSADFTVIPTLIPAITSFTPTSGVTGTEIVITGFNLAGATLVKFNGVETTAITNNTATSLKTTIPAGATTGKITVTTTDGNAISLADFIVGNWTEKINAVDGATMVWVPGGNFTMGTEYGNVWWNAPKTQQVTLSGYWIYKYEVTVAQYRKFCTAKGHALPAFPTDYSWAGKSGWSDLTIQQHPIINVTWFDCTEYAAWAGADLPSEAQWEYAVAGPGNNNFPWGGISTVADPINGWALNKCASSNNSLSQGKSTWPVGSFQGGLSWCGAQDLAGNVSEWCKDWYGDYSTIATTDPVGPATGTVKILRGGAWNSSIYNYRGAYRDNNGPYNKNSYTGFRNVVTAP